MNPQYQAGVIIDTATQHVFQVLNVFPSSINMLSKRDDIRYPWSQMRNVPNVVGNPLLPPTK